jgi:signal transduction histidine kinase
MIDTVSEIESLRSALEAERASGRSTEARLARYVRELERSNAELEQFAYAASHDLQEPLRMVVQFSSILEKSLRSKDHGSLSTEDDLCLKHMANGAERAKRLIDGLLAYSRVGRQAEFDAVSLDAALGDALELLNGAVEEAKAAVVASQLQVVWGDRQMISRIFLNLITNAIKFTKDPAPTVTISSRDLGDEVEVSVSDNGIGVDPRHAERIFGIFTRLNPEITGTGIGLAICKKIVEKHGGRIWVESIPGHGASFKFTLLKTEPGAYDVHHSP